MLNASERFFYELEKVGYYRAHRRVRRESRWHLFFSLVPTVHRGNVVSTRMHSHGGPWERGNQSPA